MALDNLTPDQHQQIIINMSAERTAVVKGIAGSGKSLTLLKKAKQVHMPLLHLQPQQCNKRLLQGLV